MVINATETHTHSHQQSQGKIAVLLMGYGEVEKYEDFANYNEQALNLLTAKFAPVPTWIYPPLAKLLAIFDLHEWSHQHNQFISPHNAIFEKQRAGIEKELQQHWGDRIQVFKAFNFCQPFLPHQVLAEIKKAGFEKLLIYPLLVVDSIFTNGIAVEQVNKAIAQLNPQTLDDTDPLWPSDLRYLPSFADRPEYARLLADLVENKIVRELAGRYAASQIGIVLMNHGCPHEAKGFTSGIKESELLYDQVRSHLIEKYPLISIGWLNHQTPMIKWTQPHGQLAVENLIELGAEAVVMMPIGFATENHETLLDVDHILHHVHHHHPQVKLLQMPCVNDDPGFLKMAAQWLHPLIQDLLTAPAIAPASQGEPETHHHAHHHHGPGHHHHHH